MNAHLAPGSGNVHPISVIARCVKYTALAVACSLVLSACVPTRSGPSNTTLYARLGAAPVLESVVSDTVDRLAAAPDGRRSFEDVNLRRLKKHIVEQLCALTGGPCTYHGDDMRKAHGGLDITEREFIAMVTILRGVLNEHGIAEREKNELLALLAPMKRDIVTAPRLPPGGNGA